jgi:hypothetical protein
MTLTSRPVTIRLAGAVSLWGLLMLIVTLLA